LYHESDLEKQEQFIKELAEIKQENRVYMDESGIYEQDGERLHGYSLRGIKIIDEKSGKRHIKQSVIAAFSKGYVIAPVVYEGTMNTERFLNWVSEDLCPILKQDQVLILDNARFHHKEKLIHLLKEKGCKVLFLPPYSPQFNLIEKVWSVMKNNIKKICDRILPLKDKILLALSQITFFQKYKNI
jgi:transposase